MKVVNQRGPSPEQFQEFFSADEDGPFVMVNLLKFREKAKYPDGSDSHLSGAEAYARYNASVAECVEEIGGAVGYAGTVSGLMLGEVEENWDEIALFEYPSLAAFRSMMMSDAYQKIAVHRAAGLEGQLNIKTRPFSVDP